MTYKKKIWRGKQEYTSMNLKELIFKLVQLAIFFAFPTIWNWITNVLPWWFLDPESTLGLIIALAITLISWILGILGIKKLVIKLRSQGLFPGQDR